MKIERIMLVDDSEPDNVYHELVLRRAGFTGDLLVFEEGRAALDYLKALPHGPVCVVLLDINMPGMDGWAFADAAAQLIACDPAIILVMLTSSATEGDRHRAAALPAIQGYVTKPLDVARAKVLLAGEWGHG